MGNISETFITGLIKTSQVISNEINEQACKVLLDNLGVVAGGLRYLKENHSELVDSVPTWQYGGRWVHL